MELFIMRHGPAEGSAASGLDADRALTDDGRERVRAVARTLAAAGEVPEQIISSMLVRARETAYVVRALARVKQPVAVANALSMTNEVRKLVDELVARGLDRRMLVGHEPELSTIIRDLTGTTVHMQTAMVVGITLSPDGGRVRFVLDPRTLALKNG